MATDFCGLTEQEAFDVLFRWFLEAGGLSRDFRGSPTRSLNSCHAAEKCLSEEQLQKYALLLHDWTWHSGTSYEQEKALIMLDAPTRCRALIKVLNLGKM